METWLLENIPAVIGGLFTLVTTAIVWAERSAEKRRKRLEELIAIKNKLERLEAAQNQQIEDHEETKKQLAEVRRDLAKFIQRFVKI